MGTRQAVVITGMGVVSPAGASVSALASALLQTRSGIQEIQAPPLRRSYPAGVVPGDPSREFSTLELIHERLLLEARRNLAYSTRSVAAVSHALGFVDPAYFTRFFKQRAGLSPRAFRARALATFSASGADV